MTIQELINIQPTKEAKEKVGALVDALANLVDGESWWDIKNNTGVPEYEAIEIHELGQECCQYSFK